MSSSIFLDGTVAELKPLAPDGGGLLQLVNIVGDLTALVPEHILSRDVNPSGVSPSHLWEGLRRSRPESLHVAVMGSSPTSGCGSSEPPHAERCKTPWDAQFRFCSLAGSWVRHMHDSLLSQHQRVFGPGASLSTHVHPRNAVGAWYFARCTQRFVQPRTNLVVLELAQVGGLPSLDAALPQLVASVRRIAPRAPIVLLLWLSKQVLHEQTAFEGTGFLPKFRNQSQLTWIINTALNVSGAPTLRFITQGVPPLLALAARCAKYRSRWLTTSQLVPSLHFLLLLPLGDRLHIQLGVEVIRMDRIAFAAASNPRMVAHGRTRLCPPAVLARPVGGASSVASSGAPPRNTRMPLQTIAPHWIYAQHGNDIVHPTPEAHILMGRVVAQYVVHRLYTAGRDEGQQLLQQPKHQHQHRERSEEHRRDSASSGVRDASSSTGQLVAPPATPRVAAPRVATPRVAAPRVAAPRVAAPRVAAPRVAARVATLRGRLCPHRGWLRGSAVGGVLQRRDHPRVRGRQSRPASVAACGRGRGGQGDPEARPPLTRPRRNDRPRADRARAADRGDAAPCAPAASWMGAQDLHRARLPPCA